MKDVEFFANRKEPKELAQKIVESLRYDTERQHSGHVVFPVEMYRKFW